MAIKSWKMRLLLSLTLVLFALEPWPLGQKEPAGPPYRFGTAYRLKETAKGLRLQPSRLEKARIALRQATAEIDIITSRSSASLSPLLPLWERIDPENARVAFLYLLDQLQADATAAEQDRVYTWASMLATDILQRLGTRNLDEARALARAWPPPNLQLSTKSALVYQYFEDRIIRRGLLKRAASEPREVLALVDQFELALSFGVRGEVARRLRQQGGAEEARQVVLDAVERFSKMQCDRELFLDYASMLERLPIDDQELFMAAYAAATAKDFALNLPARSAPASDGGDPIWFSSKEVVLLRALERVAKAPKLANSALTLAGLEEKVESVGGLEAFLETLVVQYPPLFESESSGQQPASKKTRAPRPRKDQAGEATAVQALTSSMPIPERAKLATQILQLSKGRDLPASVDSAMRSFFDQLRSEVLRGTDFSADWYSSSRQELRLEQQMLPLWAEFDFDDAMRRTQEHPHRNYRYQILRRIAHWFGR